MNSAPTPSSETLALPASAFASDPGLTNAINLASSVAIKAPAPWGQVAAAVLQLVGKGHAYIAQHRNAVVTYALEPLPRVWARPALNDFADFSASQYVESLKSLVVYRSISLTGQWDDEADATAWRKIRDTFGIDGKNRHRLAQEIVTAARKAGAPEWARAGVGYRAVYFESRRDYARANMDAQGKIWAAMLTDGYPPGTTPGAAFADRIARWQANQPQPGRPPSSSGAAGGGGAKVGLGLLALLALTR